MVIHRDNKGSGNADSGEDVKPTDILTQQLQEAYVKAGEEMASQMAAAVVSILNDVTNGRGLSSFHGWEKDNFPNELKQMIPAGRLYHAEWIVVMSKEIIDMPLFNLELLWKTELTSGHVLLVLG